jgi:hypothetical protein
MICGTRRFWRGEVELCALVCARFGSMRGGRSRGNNGNNGRLTTDYSEHSGGGQESIETPRRSDKSRDGNWRAAHHFGRSEPLARDRGDLTTRFGGDDDSRGNIVRVLAQKLGGLEPVGGDERLLTAGASQVAQPARQGVLEGSRHPHSTTPPSGSRAPHSTTPPSAWRQLEFPSPNGGCLATRGRLP